MKFIVPRHQCRHHRGDPGWPIGELRDDPDLRPLLRVRLRGDASRSATPTASRCRRMRWTKVLDFIGHAPPAMKASMALDLERGNRLELPWLNGKVVELGRQLGVPTPTHAHAATRC